MANLRDKLRGEPETPARSSKSPKAAKPMKTGKGGKAPARPQTKSEPAAGPLASLKGLDVNRRLLFASIGIAVLAGLLTLTYLTDISGNIFAGAEKVKVYVATQQLGARQQLDGEMVEVKELPRALLPEGYLAGDQEIAGKITYAPVAKGEILHALRVGGATESTGVAPKLLPTQRGFMFTIDDANGVALVKPDDYVDLTATVQTPDGVLSTEVVQRVRILSIGNRMNPGDAVDAYSNLLTLAVPANKVALLQALKEQGNLGVSLREAGDTTITPPRVSEADLVRYVLGRVRQPAAPRPVVHVQPAQPRTVYVVRPQPRPRPVPVRTAAPRGGIEVYNGTQLIHKK